VPEGVLVAGVPAQVVRQITDAERALIKQTAAAYRLKAEQHREGLGGRLR
jgi:carbonic anhydrase/acetyltransferase-like protein (isoleucine patch superfamily)